MTIYKAIDEPGFKSRRIRGRITTYIKSVLERKVSVSSLDLVPVLTRQQASTNLHDMCKRGLLKLVKPGTMGRGARQPAVFKKSK